MRGGKRSGDTFSVETKLAGLLNTLMIIFFFGFGMPLLFVYGFLLLLFLYFADRYLLVYYFKPEPVHSDVLSRTFLIILKIGPILGIVSTTIAIY